MNNFYQIIESTIEEGKVEVKMKFNEEHPLYKGHFPDNPITPGVVQIDVLKDILEETLEKSLTLRSLNRCKFLAPINPMKSQNFTYSIKYSEGEEGELKVQGSLVDPDGTAFLKTNAIFEV